MSKENAKEKETIWENKISKNYTWNLVWSLTSFLWERISIRENYTWGGA